jgi:dihydrofolate synthase/folylpolyglutamate synthase
VDFAQAEKYLLGTINESVSRRVPYRLERMRGLLAELGDPQNAYPTIHVGGTSGKGSTSTMLAAVLSADGKRTGLHVKPHLRSMTERARIDGIDVSQERFAELLAEMMPAIERTGASFGQPSYYETLLALAFVHFAREHVDIAVIEVGLGGSLDGTNVLVPLVSAITTIGYDHMDVLGESLEEIATDKAGIAKPGVPMISAVADPGARAIIEARCAREGAPFVSVLDTARIEKIDSERLGQHFTVQTPDDRYELSIPLLGGFQRTNAATAIVVLEHLPAALRPSREAIERGLAGVAIAGRMEYFPGHPGVVFDIAHNPEKAASLVGGLLEHFGDRRFVFVVAVGESKDASEILRVLREAPSTFIFTSFDTAGRIAIKPQRLASLAQDLGTWGRAILDPVEALTVARRNAAHDDIVVVTGSTFVVADLREWWLEQGAASAAR